MYNEGEPLMPVPNEEAEAVVVETSEEETGTETPNTEEKEEKEENPAE